MSSILEDIRFGFMRRHGAVAEIIVINVAVFIVTALANAIFYFFGAGSSFENQLFQLVGEPVDVMVWLQRPWTTFTNQWFHSLSDFFHLLFNMLWLFWIGIILREYQGNRKVWSTFFIGTLASSVVVLLAFNMIPVLQEKIRAFKEATGDDLVGVGASGGVFAVIVATATLLPDYGIRLFLFGTVRLKYLALVMVLLEILLLPGGNQGGKFAHLGGALYGYLYIVSLKRGTDLAQPFNWLVDTLRDVFTPDPKARNPKPKVRIVRNQNVGQGGRQGAAGMASRPSQDEVDRILEKINRVGYDGLTKEEKQTLFNASK